MTENLEPQKPTWFELTDGDAPSAQVTKVNKKLPAIAVLVAGAVIASGAFFANASDSENVGGTNSSTSISQVDNSTAAIAGTTAATEVATSPTVAPNNSGPAITSVNKNIQNPATGGMKAPGGDGDDDDDDDDEREHEGRERGERGEHRDRDEH